MRGIAVLVLVAQMSWPAHAQDIPRLAVPVCASHTTMRQALLDRYAERPRIALITTDGRQMFEVYRNTATGSWTLVRSDRSGLACIIAVGNDAVLNPYNRIPGGSDL